METLNKEQIIRIFKSYEYASYMGSDLLYLPESEYEDAANDIIKLTADRDKRISELEEKQVHFKLLLTECKDCLMKEGFEEKSILIAAIDFHLFGKKAIPEHSETQPDSINKQ